MTEEPSVTRDNTDDAAADLAREIRRRRKAAGLSQPRLATLIGYTHQYVSLAERIGQNLPSQELVRALDAALNAEGALLALREQAKAEQRARRPSLSQPASRVRVHNETAVGIGAASVYELSGARDVVLDAAHSSALLSASIEAYGISHRYLTRARSQLAQLATDYALTSNLEPILRDLVVLRNHLAVTFTSRHYPTQGRDLYQLLGATCALLASVSHDLSEPRAGMTQATTAETFAELSGDRALLAWVFCTKAMIASWWGTPQDVLQQTTKAHAAGPIGISAIRLAGLEAHALAELGRRADAIAVVHAAEDQRLVAGEHGELRELGAVFSFPSVRQHYYNATTYRHLGNWQEVEHEAGQVIDIYSGSSEDTWPVTLTLSRIYQAQARLHVHGPDGALEALRPVLTIPVTQRLPQTAQALAALSGELQSTTFARLPAARDMNEAIMAFQSTVDTR